MIDFKKSKNIQSHSYTSGFEIHNILNFVSVLVVSKLNSVLAMVPKGCLSY